MKESEDIEAKTGLYIDKSEKAPSYSMKNFHFHRKYELYYLQSGTRKYFIGEASYLVTQGNVVIIRSDEIHKTAGVDNGSHTRFVMNFNKDFLEPVIKAMPNIDLLSIFNRSTQVLALSLKRQLLVNDIFERTLELQKEPSDRNIALQRVLVAELLIYLEQFTAEQEDKGYRGGSKISNPIIDKVSTYINKNHKKSLSLNEIAEQFFVSPYYLSRLFKKTTNMSIVEYINSVRIREAKELLENSNLKMTDIALETGFSTTTHFSRIFKDSTDFSPLQYRKKYQYYKSSASLID